ncbi:MAG TPA: RdgB/HAM1 family non-canonical purine NTP pyrophosphatase [Candidatus Nitrosotenuis sp.]|jgi:XTP/dITP diphosphohydrolase|nr:RdgB/HAM1 family non-canonical purine NTP pyrophosphatase [Candidatus Nitrosotenuis sp.]
MPQSSELFFASSNRHKYEEAKEILSYYGIRLKFLKFEAVEIQSDSLFEIARKKALDAYSKCKKPIIIEDDGLFINSLGGFPGPYSSYVFKTIGNSGVIKLVKKDRRAEFCAIISYCDKTKRPTQFQGVTKGTISKKPRGRGWGYDPIFVPRGKTKTYGEMTEKNTISHRYRALKKFATWYQNRPKSSGQ